MVTLFVGLEVWLGGVLMWAWCGNGLWSYKKGRSPLLQGILRRNISIPASPIHQAALLGVYSGLRAARLYAPPILR